MTKSLKSPLDHARFFDKGKVKSISSSIKTLAKRQTRIVKNDSSSGSFCESDSSNNSKADTFEPIIDNDNRYGNGESQMPKKSGRMGSGNSQDSLRSRRGSIKVHTMKSGHTILLKRDGEGLRTGINPWVRPIPA